MISDENMDPHKAIRVPEMQFFLIFFVSLKITETHSYGHMVHLSFYIQ